MSKLKSSFAAKAVAVFLLAVMGIVFVGSLIGVGVMADAGGYAGSANTLRERVLSSMGYSQLYQTFERLYNGYNPDYAQYRSGLAASSCATRTPAKSCSTGLTARTTSGTPRSRTASQI